MPYSIVYSKKKLDLDFRSHLHLAVLIALELLRSQDLSWEKTGNNCSQEHNITVTIVDPHGPQPNQILITHLSW